MTSAGESLAALSAGMADLLLEVGLDGTIGFASASAAALTGYAPSELLGRRAIDLVTAEDRGHVMRHYLRVLRREAARTPAGLAFRARLKDGRTLWLEGNPAVLADARSGAPRGWVDVLRDMEDRRARDAALATALRGAQAGAEAHAELLANMSHEIRTPMNSIMGFMQVLRRGGGLEEVQLGHIARVEEAGRNLLTVVDDVLDLSKIEAGAIRLNERSFSPAALAEDAAALIRPQAADKRLPLLVVVAPEARADVRGDPDRLRQVLLNLLSNAVKFTVTGEVRLTLEARRRDGGLDLGFVVEDSGMGIAPEQIPRLFRRYTQADGSIAPRFGGTGLGLAISKRLMEAMGGAIEVRSGLAHGSRFAARLTLPLDAPAPARRSSRRRAPARDRRLLLADDVPINQRLVMAMLEPLGCRIDVAADGAEAVRAVQARDYALVLMDMRMPVLDGASAARSIRALGGRYAELPIIGLTANVFPEDIELALAAGMNEVVTKPIDSERLTALVTRWAGGVARAGGATPSR